MSAAPALATHVEAYPALAPPLLRVYASRRDGKPLEGELQAAVAVRESGMVEVAFADESLVAMGVMAKGGYKAKATTVCLPLRLTKGNPVRILRHEDHVEVVLRFESKNTALLEARPDADDGRALQRVIEQEGALALACRACGEVVAGGLRTTRPLPSSPLWSEDALTWHCAGCCGDAGLHALDEAGERMAPAGDEVLVGPSVCVLRREASPTRELGEDDDVVREHACQACNACIGVALPAAGTVSLFKHRVHVCGHESILMRHTALTALAVDIGAAQRTRGTSHFTAGALPDGTGAPQEVLKIATLGVECWIGEQLLPAIRVSFEDGGAADEDEDGDALALRLPPNDAADVRAHLADLNLNLPPSRRCFMGAPIALVRLL